MYDLNTPLWERYLMTIEEASSYFRIGENKLRRIASEYKDECVVMNGRRAVACHPQAGRQYSAGQ